MKGDRVEVVVDAGGSTRTYEIEATRGVYDWTVADAFVATARAVRTRLEGAGVTLAPFRP